MTKRTRSLGVGAMVLGAAFAFACGNTEKPGKPAQQAGADAGGAAPDDDSPCDLGEIEERCELIDCPTSPEEVTPACTSASTRRFSTECGGTAIIIQQGLGQQGYFFDREGKLIGLSTMTDKVMTCDDGHTSFSTIVGEICRAVGSPEDVCEGAPGCNQAAVCGTGGPSFRDCPDDLGSFDDVQCDSALHYETAASSCSSGTIVTVSDGAATVQYTFDEFGELAGTLASDDSSHRCWGMPCEPDGEVEVLCSGAGGAPATDAGGAGGMAAGGAGGSP